MTYLSVDGSVPSSDLSIASLCLSVLSKTLVRSISIQISYWIILIDLPWVLYSVISRETYFWIFLTGPFLE